MSAAAKVRPPKRGSAARMVAVLGKCLACLVLQLVGAGLQLLGLQLDPLARRRDISGALSDLLKLLHLLFVREIEGVSRVFDSVENFVRLRLHDPCQAL